MNKTKIVGAVILIIAIIWITISYLPPFGGNEKQKNQNNLIDSVHVPDIEYGFNLDSFIVYKDVIKTNENITNLLLNHKLTSSKIYQLVELAKPIFDIEGNLKAGNKYTILSTKDSVSRAQYFIYEPNNIDYVVFDLGDINDSTSVYKCKKEVTTKIQTASGIINSSLYQTLDNANISPILAIDMAAIYAWTIDFYRIQKGDWFKVVYEERFVDGKSVGLGKVLASNFNHNHKDFFACFFVQDGVGGFFDEKGNSLKRAFLKSPLKFGRMSSGFSMNRFHPVQKRNKPHLGTDYAAPKGTPIMATGNGVVIASEFSVFNGNYVKIRHNNTYTTQYLHMSKRAVKVGQQVLQGEIIGYVGSTGLATGPHVCYRFWKNGTQTNHLKEDFISSDPVKATNLEKFKIEIEKYKVDSSSKCNFLVYKIIK